MTAKQARALSQARKADASTSPEFDRAFLEHWQAVYRVLIRLVGDHVEAEDLALETFWRLYQHSSFDSRNFNIGGWLYRVATNLGLNALRAHKRRTQYELEAGRWEIELDASDPAQAVADQEERERVRAILGEMDPRQAQLLFLRHSGMSYAELANTLDLAPSSVGTLLARAEREFEKRFRQKGD